MVGGGDGGDYRGSNLLPIVDCIECELSNCLLCLATLVRVPEHDLPPSNVHGYNPVGRGRGEGRRVERVRRGEVLVAAA